MEFFIISMLNGLSYGLLLFMLSSGLTLIFRMMGVPMWGTPFLRWLASGLRW
jgi:branched-subunit amino acid ABC-type transport system permease component